MVDNSTLAQIASIIAGFGATMLYFRIQRELEMREKGEQDWMPWADSVLMSATIIALTGGVLPVLLNLFSPAFATTLARASCAAATLLLTGYIPSILAHYRLLFGQNRAGPRDNPEPAEKTLVVFTVLAAVATASLIITGIL